MTGSLHNNRGLTLIEVLIAFAVTCIFLVMTLPAHRDSLIRDRVAKAISSAEAAKKALIETCASNMNAVVARNRDAGYFYIPSAEAGDYISAIELGADCARKSMIIVIWTGNTGARNDPVITLTAIGSGHGESWSCHLMEGNLRHVPSICAPIPGGTERRS